MQPNLLRETIPACLDARAAFADTGLPSAKAEAWIYTRLSDITINPADEAGSPQADLPSGLVFQNGFLVSGAESLPTGLRFREFDKDGQDMAAFMSYLPEDHLLSVLSLGYVTGAYVIEIADNVKIDEVLSLHFVGGDHNSSSHPLVMVRLGNQSAVKIAEYHQSQSALSAPVIAIDIGEEAVFDHIKCQNDQDKAHHLALTVMKCAAKSDVNSFTTAIGSALGRHETHIHLDGEEANVALSSIYMARGNQHHDMTTRMLHHVPLCTSSQLIRGVLDDTARGVFQGKVLVAEGAQKTDGQQMSRALLLSRKAEADAKPELEIYADDVVCSHGATVGELDENHLFYLRSRGIDSDEARMMLIEAFLLDTLETIRDEALANELHKAVESWMRG